MTLVRVASVDEIAEGGSLVVAVKGKEYALFKQGGTIYCLDNDCPHAGGPLGEGQLDGTAVSCPWHCWWFDIRNGDGLYGLGIGVACHSVQVADGDVHIEI
jgi:nitrite reductase (NADH) small subunit